METGTAPTETLGRHVLGRGGSSCWLKGRSAAGSLGSRFGDVFEGTILLLEVADEVLAFDIRFLGCNYSYFGEIEGRIEVCEMCVVRRS